MSDFEERIITLCRRGDRQAFDLLVREYGSRLYMFINRMTGCHEMTDEILQEAFIKVFTGIGKYKRDAGFSRWLFRVAYNQCMDRMKSESRRAKRERLYGERVAEGACREGVVEDEVVRREEVKRLRRALETLSEKQKTAICLFAIEGFSIMEISEIMECSGGTVMSHLSRARSTLRKRLDSKEE